MKQLAQDIANALKDTRRSYLVGLLPSSLLLTLLLIGMEASGQIIGTRSLLVFMLVLAVTIPPLAADGGPAGPISRLRRLFEHGGEILGLAAVALFIPLPSTPGLFHTLTLSGVSAAIFISATVITLRVIRTQLGHPRLPVLHDIKAIWSRAPGLMLRMFIGLTLALLVVSLLGALVRLAPVSEPAQFILAVGVSALIGHPSAFLPFIMMAQALKRCATPMPASDQANDIPEEA